MKPFLLAAAFALPAALAQAEPYLARCHMGECIHYDRPRARLSARAAPLCPATW